MKNATWFKVEVLAWDEERSENVTVSSATACKASVNGALQSARSDAKKYAKREGASLSDLSVSVQRVNVAGVGIGGITIEGAQKAVCIW